MFLTYIVLQITHRIHQFVFSSNLPLSNDAPDEFHSKSSDTPDTTSGLSAFFPHRCHTELQLFSQDFSLYSDLRAL